MNAQSEEQKGLTSLCKTAVKLSIPNLSLYVYVVCVPRSFNIFVNDSIRSLM